MTPAEILQQKLIFDKRSRASVEKVFGSLTKNFTQKMWLSKTNFYSNDCIDKLKKPPIQPAYLTEYIVASIIIHSFDGWAYLGRAIDCHNRGDKDNARHFAYYAELRASISLLAAEGIGVFDKDHFIVDSSSKCNLIFKSLGTHSVTSEILKWLSTDTQWRDVILETIKPEGKTLRDWLIAFGASPAPVAQAWLNDWGLDIERLAKDREARNESSYQPSWIKTRVPLNVEPASEFIINLWSVLEPESSPNSRFKKLDLFLLRLGLENSFKGITKKTVLADKAGFELRIKKMITDLGFTDPYFSELFNFFTRRKESKDPIFLGEAQKKDVVDSPHHHMQVIGRALLMLRLSSGISSRLISKNSIKRQNIEFWIKSFGEEMGLWEKANAPSELIDLWGDIQSVLNDVELRKNQTGYKKPNSFYEWRDKENINGISLMGTLERVGLWGLGV